MPNNDYHLSETHCGFKWGPLKVTRISSGPTWGAVIEVETRTHFLQVRVTPSGRIRVDTVVTRAFPDPKERNAA